MKIDAYFGNYINRVYIMVSNAVSKHTDPIYDLKNGVFFWNSKNYEEYACTCDIRSLPRLWTKKEFDSLRSFEWMVEAKHLSTR